MLKHLPPCGLLALAGFNRSQRRCFRGLQIHTHPWLGNVDGSQTDEQRQCGYNFKINDRFKSKSPHASHVVAMSGDTNHQRGKYQWRDE